jgi:L-fuculose-phosphate aldolase
MRTVGAAEKAGATQARVARARAMIPQARPQEMVAWACRILALDGHGDLTLGHVSVRDGARVLMKRKGIGLEEVTPVDVLTIDLNGRRVAGEGTVHLEAPLHTEIYKARPDVGAVIHTHPVHGTAFGAVDARLLYLSHDALLFPEGIAVFEETADLVMSAPTGAAIARTLGDRRVVLLRNHGVLVVGKDVRWAVLSAVTLERALHLQALAVGLGIPKPIPDALIQALHASKYREEFMDEYWAYWLRRVRRAGLDQGMPAVSTQVGSEPRAARARRRGRRG